MRALRARILVAEQVESVGLVGECSADLVVEADEELTHRSSPSEWR